MNDINIVLCIYDPHGTYSKFADITITSIFMNTSANVNVYIIHDKTLSADNRACLSAAAVKFNQKISFVDVGDEVENIVQDVDALTCNFSRGTLFRLLIPELLPDIKRVIYLDCDVIVHMDIKELWDSFSGEHPVAAVIDNNPFPAYDLHNIARAKIRVDFRHYFCAGVLILDFEMIFQQFDFVKAAKDFLIKHQKIAYTLNGSVASDQDFLNSAFKNNWQQLDVRFDRFDIRSKDIPVQEVINQKNTIWHLGSKTWNRSLGLPTESLFWYYFSKSEHSDQMFASLLTTLDQTRYMPLPVGFIEWKRWCLGVIKWPFLLMKRRLTNFIKGIYLYIS